VKTNGGHPEIPKNGKFTYIIGNNGVGKSLALEGNAQSDSLHADVVVISSGLSDKFRWEDLRSCARQEAIHTLAIVRSVMVSI
jgi:ABC-type cobalamin/Fe3+-siderophores transport system ATPase subunit